MAWWRSFFWMWCISGAPQYSVLEPLFFNFLVNYLPIFVHTVSVRFRLTLIPTVFFRKKYTCKFRSTNVRYWHRMLVLNNNYNCIFYLFSNLLPSVQVMSDSDIIFDGKSFIWSALSEHRRRRFLDWLFSFFKILKFMMLNFISSVNYCCPLYLLFTVKKYRTC